MLIGLTGPAGSGKSVVANVLEAEFNFKRVRFSAGLKGMARRLFHELGFDGTMQERMIEGDLKEEPIEGLGVTPRHIMVTLGTEWGRDLIHPDLWLMPWKFHAEHFTHIVTEDVRFPNEVKAIRERGGKIWRVERPGLETGKHVSEQLKVKPDLTLVNDRDLEGFEIAVRALVRGALSREG